MIQITAAGVMLLITLLYACDYFWFYQSGSMQKLELYYWMDTQLTGLIDSAAAILTGKPTDAEIADFFRRSAGVSRFIRHYIGHSVIRDVLRRVPEVEYRPVGILGKLILFYRGRQSFDGRYIVNRKLALAEIKASYDAFAAIYNLHQAEAA